MKIVLVTGHQYPVGTALTNRIRSYLEVLATIGHEVKVLIYKPSENRDNIQNTSSGAINGVFYQSCAYSIVKLKNPLLSRLTWIYGYLNCIFLLYKENRIQHIDVIIQASSKSSIIPLVFLQSKLHGIRFVLENSEYPWFILKKKSIVNSFNKLLYLGLYYKMFDGVLAMTQNLKLYHEKHCKKTARIFHLPMTVDMSRFQIDVQRENLITYVGNNSFNKDGVNFLVEAFMSIAEKYPDWNLVIIGNTGHDDRIRNWSAQKNLSNRIIMLGNIHRDKVPELLCKSKILALSRPDNLQAEGGFPTKLGEYLATGNLVIVTKVGEIGMYLTDNVSALLSEPNDAKAFANKLEYGASHYNELGKIRDAGFQVCKAYFNSLEQGKNLHTYLSALCLDKS